MKAYTQTSIGLVRERNEDAIWISGGAHGLYILADGMGGHRAGDVASAMATQILARQLSICPEPTQDMLSQAFQRANEAVYTRQLTDEALSGMGTTLTALWEDADSVLLGHVGDSRAYLLREGKLTQMTEDHSMVGEMLRAGAITGEQARSHPYRNVITRAVGTEETLCPDIFRAIKQKGDLWLLCSDGLTDMVDDTDIKNVLTAYPPQDAAHALVELALENGGSDNISVLLLEVDA